MRYSLTAVIVLLTATTVFAHGPQIQITRSDTGKIVTRNAFADEPYNTILTDPKTAYVIPMTQGTALGGGLEFASRPYGSQGPGIAYGYGWTFDPLFMTFPAGSNFRITFTDGLKRWNGSSFVDPGPEQIQMHRVSANIIVASAITSDTGPFAGMDLPVIQAPGSATALDAHNSIRYRLLGTGGTSTEPTQDGIYLVSMQISSTAAGVTPSDPYSFILHKNVPLDDVLAVVSATFPNPTLVQVVPEPASLLVFVAGGLLVLRRRGV
jgi:hypothetical protein